MPTTPIARILLIDDLEINNEISTFTIRKALPDIEIIAFSEPVQALDYIKTEYQQSSVPTLVFLDINMPVCNSWELLHVLDSCDSRLSEYLHIYILTSSIDPRDKRRATDASKVLGYLERPLTPYAVQEILFQLRSHA